MPLSEPQVRSAKPRSKPYKLFDSGGLYVLVNPSGSKLWRMRFVVDGKEKVLAFGAYRRSAFQKPGKTVTRRANSSTKGSIPQPNAGRKSDQY